MAKKRKRVSVKFKIDKKIPMPGRAKNHSSKYRWSDLKVGDSVLLNTPSAGYFHAKKATKGLKPRQFKAKTVEGGVRVWRIK